MLLERVKGSRNVACKKKTVIRDHLSYNPVIINHSSNSAMYISKNIKKYTATYKSITGQLVLAKGEFL